MKIRFLTFILAAMLLASCSSTGTPAVTETAADTTGVTETAAESVQTTAAVPESVLTTAAETEPEDTESCPYIAGMDLAPDVKAESVSDSFDDAAANFSAELFRGASAGDGNVLISPMSAMFALAMVETGAKGDTLREMAEVLGGDMCPRSYISEVLGLRNSYDGSNTVHIANGIWYRDGGVLMPCSDYLGACTRFRAPVIASPFNSSTVSEINNWVSDNTDGYIDGIIDSLPEDSMMVLANAMTFRAEWASPYGEHQVQTGDFTNADGSVSTVEMMHSDEYYTETDKATGLVKYYESDRYAFIAALPKEGDIDGYIKGLDGSEILGLIENERKEKATAVIPKFETEFESDLSAVLSDMGMPTAFGYGADFSGMGDGGDGIFISNVLHKAFIEVNETGTVAAASTAVIMYAKGEESAVERKTVMLDRPFVYMIVDMDTGVPLFAGCIRQMQ